MSPLEARLAQLELIAKLARKAVARYAAADLDTPEWMLALALADLDSHPDTRSRARVEDHLAALKLVATEARATQRSGFPIPGKLLTALGQLDRAAE